MILGIFLFPSIAFLEFKSKEELQLMPQTVEEHIQDMEDSDSDTSSLHSDDDDGDDNQSIVSLTNKNNFTSLLKTLKKPP